MMSKLKLEAVYSKLNRRYYVKHLINLKQLDLLLISIYFVLFILFVLEAFRFLNYDFCSEHKGAEKCLPFDYRVKKFGQNLGSILQLTIGLALIPPAKNSILCKYLLKTTFERVIRYHRWLGRFIFIVSTIHGSCFVYSWNLNGVLMEKILHGKPQIFYGVLAYIALFFLLFLSSLEIVRRNYYRFFFINHVVGCTLFIIFLLFHYEAGGLVAFIAAPIGLLIYDWFCRYYNGNLLSKKENRFHVTVNKLTLIGNDVIKLELVCTDNNSNVVEFYYQAGQYLYLCIPAISKREFHPFSIYGGGSVSNNDSQYEMVHLNSPTESSDSPGANNASKPLLLYIRKSKHSTSFTNRLASYANTGVVIPAYSYCCCLNRRNSSGGNMVMNEIELGSLTGQERAKSKQSPRTTKKLRDESIDTEDSAENALLKSRSVSADLDNIGKNGSNLPAFLHGPYGSLELARPLEAYQTVLFIAGGIGVVPVLSYLLKLINSISNQSEPKSTRLTFVWATREVDLIHEFAILFENLMSSINDNVITLKIKVHLTRDAVDLEDDHLNHTHNELNCYTHFDIIYVRPNVATLILTELEKFNQYTIRDQQALGIVVCGPTSLMDEVILQRKRYQTTYINNILSIDLHLESYEL